MSVPPSPALIATDWSRVRRKFILAAAGNDALEKWRDRWLDRIGRLLRLNRVRLRHCGPEAGMEGQLRRFGTAHRQLRGAVDRLFALAGKERAGPAGSDRRATALNSLVRHREGLSLFVGRPALHRGRAQGLRMDPCRHDPGTGQVRQEERMGEAQEGQLALPAPQGLEADAQPLIPVPLPAP